MNATLVKLLADVKAHCKAEDRLCRRLNAIDVEKLSEEELDFVQDKFSFDIDDMTLASDLEDLTSQAEDEACDRDDKSFVVRKRDGKLRIMEGQHKLRAGEK